ncbi:PAAR domain-containing protein [Paraburkholderia sp. BL17N1]|uniref:PAAR domain-containing protein n=1 Tax=Paraburkholderia sp. BL17N1 TaxID=1938798 RepID=UPI000EAF3831|nr:PAAR domain-containing protein [Paraburkholderia sp. BL17N1]RKR43822.1 PAAR motif-containing protein [Paraburkholderia sp. BL17N1]
MRKALVVQGSPTTTGGLVIGGSATHMTDHGKPFALDGDEATCGKCEGVFRIVGTATRRRYRGQPGVVEGDPVLCPCGLNYVMAGLNPGCFYWTDDIAVAASAVASTIDNASRGTGIYDEQVCGATTVANLEGYPYFIESAEGRTFSGRLGKDGLLPRVRTDAAAHYKVYWGDDALARQEGV